MSGQSPAVKAIQNILASHLGLTAEIDQLHGDPHLSLLIGGVRFRIYIEKEFERLVVRNKELSASILGYLVNTLRNCPTHAVKVTADGIECCPGPEFVN